MHPNRIADPHYFAGQSSGDELYHITKFGSQYALNLVDQIRAEIEKHFGWKAGSGK